MMVKMPANVKRLDATVLTYSLMSSDTSKMTTVTRMVKTVTEEGLASRGNRNIWMKIILKQNKGKTCEKMWG